MARARPARTTPHPGTVVPLLVERDDHALVEGLKRSEPWATAAFFDRYAPAVERLLRRVLGGDRQLELVDLVHDVFVQALSSVHRLRDAEALLAWLQGIAAHTAYRTIRSRRARRWLHFFAPAELPELPTSDLPPEVREALVHTYRVLERMPASERMVFTLRYVEGMEVAQLAAVLDVSASTVKRRLAKAEARFRQLSRRDAVLRAFIEESPKWTD